MSSERSAGITALEKRLYNATVTGLRECAPGLRILRIRPDAGPADWIPGQYLGLGLGVWAPRADPERVEEIPPGRERELMVRHYSFSHPILREGGDGLMGPAELDFHEFYVALPAYDPGDRTPRFTPRLFSLKKGDRLYVENEAAGEYTAAQVRPSDDVLFVATGTGEAPHNALIWLLLTRGHTGRIASTVCTRRRSQLGYLETHRALERIYPSYRYLPLTTREPENRGQAVRLQESMESGALERDLGWVLQPGRARIFLCGNPAMIGVPRRRPGSREYPEPRGMIEVLEKRGFNADERSGQPVDIHYERFW